MSAKCLKKKKKMQIYQLEKRIEIRFIHGTLETVSREHYTSVKCNLQCVCTCTIKTFVRTELLKMNI